MTDTPTRRAPGLIIELAIVMVVLVSTKLIFDQIAWRFAGPISLTFTLAAIAGTTDTDTTNNSTHSTQPLLVSSALSISISIHVHGD